MVYYLSFFLLFFVYHQHNIHIVILVYVDDILVIGTHEHFIAALITRLQQHFPLKVSGSLKYFHGIQAIHTSSGLHLNQAKYIHDLLHRVRMIGDKTYTTPYVSGSELSARDGEQLVNPSEFQHIVGALQYCTSPHPNIAYFVNHFC